MTEKLNGKFFLLSYFKVVGMLMIRSKNLTRQYIIKESLGFIDPQPLLSKKCILRNSGHPFEIAKREKSSIYFTHFYF